MKKFCPLLIGLLLLGSLNSCDWIRSRLGMPTSDELKLRQSLMLRDSLDKVARARKIPFWSRPASTRWNGLLIKIKLNAITLLWEVL